MPFSCVPLSQARKTPCYAFQAEVVPTTAACAAGAGRCSVDVITDVARVKLWAVEVVLKVDVKGCSSCAPAKGPGLSLC
jgi:hypothetical protein